MICVCIGRTRHKRMIEEHRHLVQKGVKLVELRLDYIGRTVNLKRLISDRAGPVIVTCRRQKDGGKWKGSEQDRITLLRSAIAEGVEYVDLESDIAAEVPRFGKTKRIVSYHNFDETPDNLEQLHADLAALDADVVKIATMAKNTHDNQRMLSLIANSDIATVGLCMGEIGSPTRLLATKFGAPFTYTSFSDYERVAPGQFSYREMTGIFDADRINASTQVFGVIADPVGHSLSPHIHNASLQQLGLDCVYLPIRVPPEDLKAFIADCPSMGISGLSVTIPHKETVLPLTTLPDDQVQGIGATNTLVFKDGEIHAHNTDCSAALGSLEETLGIKETTDDCLVGKTAMLLGGGGVAKAIAYGLRRRGAKVIVAARTPSKAVSLQTNLGCEIIPWEERHATELDILVNCTPIGMSPNIDASPFDAQSLHPSMIVFDTIYNPEETLLIQSAQAANCAVVTGLDMFVRQAAIQFELFTGADAPTNVMRRVLKDRLDEK